MKIHVWSDYIWCRDDELGDMILDGASEEFRTYNLPLSFTDDDIEDFLGNERKKGEI